MGAGMIQHGGCRLLGHHRNAHPYMSRCLQNQNRRSRQQENCGGSPQPIPKASFGKSGMRVHRIVPQ
jgi:hypothetical protein